MLLNTAYTEQQMILLLARAYGATNPNLLYNPEFRNPVNQRGIVSGSTVSATGYFLDMWTLLAGSLIWTSGVGVTTGAGTTWWRGYLENPLEEGKQYTFSAVIGGTIYSATLTANSTTAQYSIVMTGVYLEIGYAGGRWYASFYIGAIVTIARAKLELGTVSTLANDPPADFDVELGECLRYYWDSKYDQYGCSGIAIATNIITTSLNFPVPMRILPTCSVFYGGTQNHVRATNTGADITLVSPIIYANQYGIPFIYVASAPFTKGEGYDFRVIADAGL